MEYAGRFAQRVLFFKHNVSPLDNHLRLSITYIYLFWLISYAFFCSFQFNSLIILHESSLSKKIFSGVAGIIVALGCCTAVGKLCYRHTCCPFTLSIEDALVELMDLSQSCASEQITSVSHWSRIQNGPAGPFWYKGFPLQEKQRSRILDWVGSEKTFSSIPERKYVFRQANLLQGPFMK